MATNVTLKRKTASGTDDLHPTTDWSQINSKPGTFAPTAHTHGNINDDGQISASAPIASGDHLVIADNSSNNDLTTSSITFGTGTTTFLRNDGTWGTPAGTADTNNYLTGVSGSGDGTVTFTRQGLGNLTWNAAHSHSEYLTSNADDTMTGDLLLSNAALSYQGQNGVAVPVPQGGLFATTSSTQTGYLKITLPVSWTSTMLSFFVDIYEYTADESFTLQLAGYNYSSSSQWINTTANLVSSSTNRVFNVRFGHDGSKCAIYIGESNSTWSYMQVRVRDFLGGYSNATPSNWADGWAVGFTTTLGTITSTQSLESEVTNADTADKLTTARTITLGGDLTGNVSFDGSANVTLSAAVANDSHTHDGRYYTETESNANFLKRTSTSLLDVNAANGTQLYIGSTGQWTNRGPAGNNAGALLSLNTHSGNYYSQLWFDTANDQFYFRSANNSLPTGSWQKVFHDGNDGSGSGLDSDKLDGQHGSYYAPKASPALTGTPTAPTAAANTNTTQIATTAYVQGEITDLIGGAPGALDTLNELAAAINDDSSYASTITTALAAKAPLASPSFTGNVSVSGTITANGLTVSNDNIVGVNQLEINDPGEGIVFKQGSSGDMTLAITDDSFDSILNFSGTNAGLAVNGTAVSLSGHNHDSRYYTESEVDTLLSGKAASSHTHDDRYYTESEVNTLLAGKASSSHTHSQYLESAGDTMTGDLVLDHDGTGTAADSHALRFTARAANTDFSREIKLEDGGGFAFDSNILLTGDVTTNNAARTIDFTGFDKEGTTDFTDRAFIQHTTNTGGHSGSVLVISSQNDSSDGIAFQTNGSSQLKHNSNTIWDAGNDGPGSGLNADLLDGNHASAFYLASNPSGYTSNTGTVTSVATGGGLTGGTITGSGTISHADTSSQASLTALTGANVISDIDVDTYGHITSMATRALTPANIGAASSSHNHSASEIVTGNFNTARLGSGTATSGYVLKSDGDGTASWQQDNNTTYTLGSFGVTATAAELNKMDGVTATTAELNKMDGVTATTTELNYTDGVTSNIQTQLNGKLSTTGTAAQASAVSYVTSCPTANNTTGMKVYVGSTDCSTKYSGWLYLVT